jgi:hypothetical protein
MGLIHLDRRLGQDMPFDAKELPGDAVRQVHAAFILYPGVDLSKLKGLRGLRGLRGQ